MKLKQVGRVFLKDYKYDEELEMHGDFSDAVDNLERKSDLVLVIDKEGNKTIRTEENFNGGGCDCCGSGKRYYRGDFVEVIGYKMEE